MRLAWGTALVAGPDRVLEMAHAPTSRLALRTARLLGARHLGQAAAVWSFPQPAVWRWSRRVDAAHGLSMAALAVASPTFRRAGLTSLTVAGALILLSRER